MNKRTIIFKASYWSYEDTEDNELMIYIGGHTKDNESVFVKMTEFYPFVTLELPMDKPWNKTKCKILFEYFQSTMKSSGPKSYKLCKKNNIYYNKQIYAMNLYFPTNKACYTLYNKCTSKYGFTVYNLCTFPCDSFKVHEQNIDPLIKFPALKNISLAGWIKVVEEIPEDEKYTIEYDENRKKIKVPSTIEDRKFTTADIDLCTIAKNVSPYNDPKLQNVVSNPKYCSFDIECYSKNHSSKMPDPNIPENVIFQIAMIFGRFGKLKKSKKVLLTLFDPHDEGIKDTKIIRCKSEKDLLLEFTNLVQIEDPDAFITFNGMKFDWDYMIKRAKLLGIFNKFSYLGKTVGVRSKIPITSKKGWTSKAYGKQVFKYFDCHGRIDIDVLLEIGRNFKLPKYSLNAVSEYFLKDKKDDITPRQLFMLFKITKNILPIVQGKKIYPKQLERIKRIIMKEMPERQVNGIVKKLRDDIKKATCSNIVYLIRQGLTYTGKYCVQDTILPIKLAEKLNIWTTMCEMSNITGVPISYLYTRGQQIKVLAQFYRITVHNKQFIPYAKRNEEATQGAQGAIVIEAAPGIYNLVVTLDFASLYPTVIIAYNICYTTILEDNDPTPDKVCHVLEWNEHIRCEHDPLKRKPEKNKPTRCGHHRYRFRKVKIVRNRKGEYVRINEGLLPRLERDLLSGRKVVKWEMFKAEARLNMQRGLASNDDITFYKKKGIEIIKKKSLGKNQEMMLDSTAKVLNAKQLAIKISCNSAYGFLGVQKGYAPLIAGAASVTAMSRHLIMSSIEYIKRRWSGSKLIYGDTDSGLFYFSDMPLKEIFEIGKKVGKETTHYLKSQILGKSTVILDGEEIRLDEISSKDKKLFDKLSEEDKISVLEYESIPIDLEFENVYGKLFLFSKKRYKAFKINEDADVVGVIEKGLCTVRRDNSKYLRDGFRKIDTPIMDGKSEKEIMNILYDHVHKLFTCQIPETDLIIYTGITEVINYAKNKKIKNKNTGNEKTFYLDVNKDIIGDVLGPLDPRLVYKNLPQALLALKLLRRGETIPPNTRLEYLYIENPEAVHQGDKAEDYVYYTENKSMECMRPDYLHYIEKQLMKPITEMLTVAFPREMIIHEKPIDTYHKYIFKLSDFEKDRLSLVDTFYKDTINLKNSRPYTRTQYRKAKVYLNLPKEGVYIHHRVYAKIEYILYMNKNEGTKYNKRLIEVCKQLKARDILDRIYRKYKVRKRDKKRATQTGEKLRVGGKVALLYPVREYKIHHICKIIQVYETEIPSVSRGSRGTSTSSGGKSFGRLTLGKKKAYKYNYDLVLDKKKEDIIKHVPRNGIATFRYKDSTALKDIYKIRKGYKEVVERLKNEFSTINYI